MERKQQGQMQVGWGVILVVIILLVLLILALTGRL